MKEIKTPPVYICSIQEEQNIRRSFTTENHPYHIFVLCTRGRGSIITEQINETEITENTLIYIGPAILSVIRSLSEDFSLRMLGFNGSAASGFMDYCGLDMTGVIHDLPREFVYDFNQLHEAGCCDMSDTTVGIYRFICRLCSFENSRAGRVSSYESFLRTSFETFAARNLSYGIDANDFCKKTGISETELDKALDGGISETIKKCRISETKRLLITRPDDLRETICRYCGFLSVQEMEKEFEEYTGNSVDEFIDSYK